MSEQHPAEIDVHDKCSDTFGWCSLCRPGGRVIPSGEQP